MLGFLLAFGLLNPLPDVVRFERWTLYPVQSSSQVAMPDSLRNDIFKNPTRALQTLRRNPRLATSVHVQGQETPLHCASQAGAAGIVRWLIANGAEVNARCYNQFTALHLADTGRIAEILVRAGANLDCGAVFGATAMQYAAEYAWHYRTTGRAIRGPDNAKAAEDGPTKATYKKWEKERLSIIDAIRRGGQPLDAYSAYCLGQTNLVRTKIRKRPEQAKAIKVDDRTLLHLAARDGDIDTAKLLLSIGMNVDVGEYVGMNFGGHFTPLVDAVWARQTKMVEFLCANGADPRKMEMQLDRVLSRPETEVTRILKKYIELRKRGGFRLSIPSNES